MAVCHTLTSGSLASCVVPASSVHTRSSMALPSFVPGVPHGRYRWQSPGNPVQMAASFTNAHSWQQMDGTHNMTSCRTPGSRGPAVGPCVCAPPWSRTVQPIILLAVSLQKEALQLDAYQTLGHSGQTSTGFLAPTCTFDGSP